jgi:hypothetical protein
VFNLRELLPGQQIISGAQEHVTLNGPDIKPATTIGTAAEEVNSQDWHEENIKEVLGRTNCPRSFHYKVSIDIRIRVKQNYACVSK